MDNKKVLIIDDDLKLAEALQAYLAKYQYPSQFITDPTTALDIIQQFKPDLITLDIMMPEIDGLALCKEIRKQYDTPIIFLSARGDTPDRIVGLELGADDYLPKPFEPRELVARIESILRRRNSDQNPIPPEGLQLNTQNMEVHLNEDKLDFTSTEFQALNFLYENHHRIVSRDELLSVLQGVDSEVYGRAIDILISRIRQKLNDNPKDPQYIKTIRGQGYRYIGGH